jgi:hypothetical protein
VDYTQLDVFLVSGIDENRFKLGRAHIMCRFDGTDLLPIDISRENEDPAYDSGT